MTQAMASMAGLRGNSQAVLEGSLQISGSTRLNVASNTRVGLVSLSEPSNNKCLLMLKLAAGQFLVLLLLV